MTRVWNFSAGPSTLPEEVLKKAAAEMLDYQGMGLSVMEMSHRSKVFGGIVERTKASLRELMAIPDHYQILLLQGGASTQFAMVPMNLMARKNKVAFMKTGRWSAKALEEAKLFGEVLEVASSEDKNYSYIPKPPSTLADLDVDYVHITTNNTIYGTRFHRLPDPGTIPLVADMSSDILSEPFEVSDFGLIYAGAQKNAGAAGMTIVIVRDDLMGSPLPKTPTMMNYQIHADKQSLYNTPGSYAIYISGLVFEWLLQLGGVAEMEQRNKAKAKVLYECLDHSRIFRATVKPPHRSRMNIPFLLPSEALDRRFIREAEAAGFVTLKGHSSVGGMRASIYNAMPLEGVERLVDFMMAFEKNL